MSQRQVLRQETIRALELVGEACIKLDVDWLTRRKVLEVAQDLIALKAADADRPKLKAVP